MNQSLLWFILSDLKRGRVKRFNKEVFLQLSPCSAAFPLLLLGPRAVLHLRNGTEMFVVVYEVYLCVRALLAFTTGSSSIPH